MAMTRRFRKKVVVYLLLCQLMRQTIAAILLIIELMSRNQGCKRIRYDEPRRYSIISRMGRQLDHMKDIIYDNDEDCISNTRMDRNAFARLCYILREFGGLADNKYVRVDEQVAIFLSILSHHTKIRIVKCGFKRPSHTISRYLHLVLKAVLRVSPLLLVKPRPIEDSETNQRWKWFKGCIGALDGTYIPVQVSICDKPRYRTRKGDISTNVLAACNRDMNFVYVLPGWEGSAADARVLRDAVTRPNGLRIPKGHYFLCDNGYANSDGFLTPYRGVMYHRRDWPPACIPSNYEEYFNMQHAKARNVIERSFAVIKMRWAILRSNTFYPIQTQTRLIMACFLIHNYIRAVMAIDPMEVELDLQPRDPDNSGDDVEGGDQADFVDTVESSPEWTAMRNDLARAMYAGFGRGR